MSGKFPLSLFLLMENKIYILGSGKLCRTFLFSSSFEKVYKNGEFYERPYRGT